MEFEVFLHDFWRKLNHLTGTSFTTPEIIAAGATAAEISDYESFIGKVLLNALTSGSNTFPTDAHILQAYQKSHPEIYYAVNTPMGVEYQPVSTQTSIGNLTPAQLMALVKAAVHAELLDAGLVK